MAKIRNNVVVRGMSGGFGEQVVLRHMRDGSTVAANMPDFSKREFSPKQQHEQSRFRQAVAYAKRAADKQPIYAELAAGTLKNAYNVALSDWLHPPVIHAVERSEGCIRIRATDNVRVDRVEVTILDEEGGIREKGEGVKVSGARCEVSGEWWEYTTMQEGRVRVEAWDLAGNNVIW